MTDLRLRGVRENDLPTLFEQQNDPEANRMAAFPARDREAFAEHWAKILRDPEVVARVILFDGHVAGNIVCWEQDGRSLVGYWIGRDFWGKGVATRALAEFVTIVEKRPLWAFVAKQNVASVRVLEKCGFVRCGEEEGLPGLHGEPVVELLMRLDGNDDR